MNSSHKYLRGFTIVEMMISLLLSSILLAGVVQIYASSKQSYRLTENVSRMQENSRFAMNILTKEIRMAGFSPCPRTDEVAITLTGGATSSTDFGNGAIVGFEGNVDSFPSDFPATGTAAGNRVADSDGFILMRGGDNSYTLGTPPHNASSAQFSVIDVTGLSNGDILMVCDNDNTAIFQANNITDNSGSADDTLVHNQGNGSGSIDPGNCSKGLGYPTDCSTANGNPHSYDSEAQIVKMISTIYYVGISQSGNGRALYRRALLNNTGGAVAAGAAQELVDGIESMQAIFGVDTSGDSLANRYVTADQVGATNWNSVVSVRVALLSQTPDQINFEDDDNTYYLAGTQFDDTSHGADKRLRQVYTSTIKIRNRGDM
jgi:type IV pilus assembly protein PilW